MSETTVLHSRRAIYVGGLADDADANFLRAALVPFGPVLSIDIPMDYAKGVHKNFAFVEFEDPEDAQEAIFNMDGAELMGRTLNVNLAQQNQMKLGSNKAVWSNDEWFQQQAGLENKEDEEERRAAQEDQSTLKEKAPIPR